MIHIFPFHNNQCKIGIIYINETSNELLSELEHKNWYYQKLQKMTETRKQEWLATRILLKKILMKEKKIIYTNSGKPYLLNNQFYISISHTKKIAAIIVNKKKQVSIDIEYISPRIQNIQNYFLNKIEKKNLSQKELIIHLLLHWSAKEVIYKFLNKKEVEFKTQFYINPFEPIIGKWANFSAYEILTKEHQLFNIEYIVTKNYVLCLLIK